MKDAVATMGTILADDVGGRDAVHVAVISVTAAAKLFPGQDVGFVGAVGENEKVGGPFLEPIGIVDPFIKSAVQPDQRFWLYLYPRTITSLRHNWTHPKFADAAAGATYSAPSQKHASEKWLRDFIERSDCPGYEAVINAAIGDHDKNADDGDYLSSSNDGNSLSFGGRNASGDIPPEFWDHVEIVTGRKITKRATYFSCSC